ncbi:MAG: adenylosuccinate synthase [Planctomycetia bacterium]|nr:adenylosuccinate synthase [Planctomycetia bacterium]
MAGTCVIGLQWGDEAKGKIVDVLTQENRMVVRYQGGANAGHTVVRGGEKFKLSLLPSGIFHENVHCVIAGGVVLDPISILAEIGSVTARNVYIGARNLSISDRAHVIFPWHVAEDHLTNIRCSSGEAIGTTGRGIGPCYRDKAGRSFAIRLGDMFRSDFAEKVRFIVKARQPVLDALAGEGERVVLDADAIIEEYSACASKLKPMVTDTTALLLDAVDADQSVLFEGAQGSLLDIDHGTFPYVTSSNSSGVGVPASAGIPPRFIRRIVGIAKAYTTRVGGGPFPTEQENAIGQLIRDRGHEYGTVTKRPRRCGWFDAVAVRYAIRLGGIDTLCVSLLDVLSEVGDLKICTSYEIDGPDGKYTTNVFPSHVEDLRHATPVYETAPGWKEDLSSVRTYEELPGAAKNYLHRISELVGCRIGIVSVGPDRLQTIFIPG